MKFFTLFISTLLCLSTGMRAQSIDTPPTLSNDSLTWHRLGDLDLSLCQNGWGTLKQNKSIDGNVLSIGGKTYKYGIGAHATFKMVINLNAASHFSCVVGMDDETNGGNVNYSVILIKHDGTQVTAKSGNISTTSTYKRSAEIDIDTKGYKYMILLADENGTNSYDHVDWANGYFTYNKIVTTEPFTVNPATLDPSLDCATMVYAIPGVRFMQKIRTTSKDADVSVSNLPDGLVWNERRQLIEGTLKNAGTYTYTATTTLGGKSQEQKITLECSDNLNQPTPFMGMLTWNVFEHQISADKVYAIADAFLEYGLLDAGYKYVCLDDQWAKKERDANGKLQYDDKKFPEGLNKVADYVHGKGLKFGVYSDGGSYTCSGAQPGSYKHEATDAQSFNRWGFDLLKYDYCNNPGSSASVARKVYGDMGAAVRKYCDPSFIFYLCEWGDRNPWEWGAETGGTCWRCTADTRDCWINNTYKGGVKDNIDIFKGIYQYSGVNRWNDADMVMCGLHGTGKSSNAGTNGKGMTMDEYKTQFALWCMWSSPITLSFDITTLGDGKSKCGSGVTNTHYKEDLALITNKDLIALDQDRLGQAGEPIYDTSDYIVFMKDLENGDVAISVTNLTTSAIHVPLKLKDFDALEPGLEYSIHNCMTGVDYKTKWSTETEYSMSVAPHATQVYRLIKPQTETNIKALDEGKKINMKVDTYNISGRKAMKNERGIVIKNGKKTIK